MTKWPKDDVHPRIMLEREYGEWARDKIVVLEAELEAVKAREEALCYSFDALLGMAEQALNSPTSRAARTALDNAVKWHREHGRLHPDATASSPPGEEGT